MTSNRKVIVIVKRVKVVLMSRTEQKRMTLTETQIPEQKRLLRSSVGKFFHIHPIFLILLH